MKLTVLLFILLTTVSSLCAQEANTVLPLSDILTSRYAEEIISKTTRLQRRLDDKTEKVLRDYQKQERRIARKLWKKDSIAARNFGIVSLQKYEELQQKISNPGKVSQYIPSLDTLSTSLSFLKQAPALAKNKEVLAAIDKVKSISEKLQKGEDIKQYLREQKQYLKEQLAKFGLVKEFRKISKNAYYYSEELLEIKETLKDQKKIERKAIELLSRTRVFQQFMEKNSILAAMFRLPGTDNPLPNTAGIVSLAGLQTRTQVNQLIQNQVAAGGPNAQQQIQSNLQQAQGQLYQLRDQLNQYGSRSSDDIMPEGFVPNPEKSRPFLKRMEFNTNIQSQAGNRYFPVSSDIGVGLGYRFTGNGVLGVGASYKIGWGQKIQHIKITHQGIGLRSYVDWKFPVSIFNNRRAATAWWLSGGYEQNYRSEIKRIEELKNRSAWQASGLIGISKKFTVSSKFMKGTKLQLLWDFLSYEQVPRTSPLLFRAGYNIK